MREPKIVVATVVNSLYVTTVDFIMPSSAVRFGVMYVSILCHIGPIYRLSMCLLTNMLALYNDQYVAVCADFTKTRTEQRQGQ